MFSLSAYDKAVKDSMTAGLTRQLECRYRSSWRGFELARKEYALEVRDRSLDSFPPASVTVTVASRCHSVDIFLRCARRSFRIPKKRTTSALRDDRTQCTAFVKKDGLHSTKTKKLLHARLSVNTIVTTTERATVQYTKFCTHKHASRGGSDQIQTDLVKVGWANLNTVTAVALRQINLGSNDQPITTDESATNVTLLVGPTSTTVPTPRGLLRYVYLCVGAQGGLPVPRTRLSWTPKLAMNDRAPVGVGSSHIF